jgi:hypothetical protein
MSWGFDDISCGGQLQVGTGIVPAIKQGDEKINGSMHCEGPAVFGGPTEFPDNFATLMVGRTKNDDKDCVPANKSLYVKGNTVIEGDTGTSKTLYIDSSAGQAININNGTVWINDSGEAMFKIGTGGKTMSARFSESDGKPKPFDIPHPSKGEGWRLRYACIEGAEVGVYHRGRLRRGKEIFLPRYWKDLVHINSITVQLQPIGAHQDIIIKRWDDEKIYLQTMGGMPIDCFYHVYAERKDINPLITEYQGKDCFDYPDPNYKPGVANPRYDDPDFAGPPNTITM